MKDQQLRKCESVLGAVVVGLITTYHSKLADGNREDSNVERARQVSRSDSRQQFFRLARAERVTRPKSQQRKNAVGNVSLNSAAAPLAFRYLTTQQLVSSSSQFVLRRVRPSSLAACSARHRSPLYRPPPSAAVRFFEALPRSSGSSSFSARRREGSH